MKKIVGALAGMAIGNSVLLWAIQEAYSQRGYQAYGGEYLLAVLVAILVYYIIVKI